ncbi:hypothetical protein [Wenzhouxiangella limi]|uniref:Exo-alpha-sialidase n=1 Tax=Wenzhouxiangella limi TaxID=2707351 RepID=A0A845UYT0_9GAMM|nr:hypothetical protein [Wenzhouxiangella limi]NDY95654.1 hypothetical protein [Wenzhouxiangella limi]
MLMTHDCHRRGPRHHGLLVLAVLSLAACDRVDNDAAQHSAAQTTAVAPAPSRPIDRQTAFRIRGDADAGLNVDEGWAAPVNQAATVLADRPFRLRFEVEAGEHDTAPRQYRLEFRRNNGEWRPLPAENFPQPAKLLELGLDPSAQGPIERLWRFVQGTPSAMRWRDEEDGYLRVETEDEPLLALARYRTPWQQREFALELRLSEDDQARIGLVFDYLDSENHSRVEVVRPSTVRVIQRADGTDTVIAEHRTEVESGRWLEMKTLFDGAELEVEFDDDRLVFSETLASEPAPMLGLFVPENTLAAVRSVGIEGEPRTPRTSIIASKVFAHEAPTQDLLSVSKRAFSGGAGVSFAEQTPAWSGAGGHGEWEFPLVIRYFSDDAVINETGDRFDYRLVDASGAVLPNESMASVTLEVPDGHLGGTFVETPMRIGPWQAETGALYFLMEPAETWNALMAVKSSDDGRTWREMDGGHRPQTGDLEGFGSVLVEDRIHMLHQTSDDVWYHVFNTADHRLAPDTWAISDERVASPPEPPTQVADIAVRSEGSVVAVYGGPDKLRFRIRSAQGEWGEERVIDPETSAVLSGPTVVLGGNDEVHLAYTDSDGNAWYRKILRDNALTDRVRVSDELGTASEDVGSILPLLHLPDSDSISLIYRTRDGLLFERRVGADGQWRDPVRVSDRAVVQNSVDSDQVGADAIVIGDTLHVLLIEEGSGELFHVTRRADGWEEVGVVVGDEEVQWVRGSRVALSDGGLAYGYVYDGGADGGSGKNRYGQIVIKAP